MKMDQEKIYEPSVWFEVSNNTWHWISDRHNLVVKPNVAPLSLRKRRRGMRRKMMYICNIYVRRFGLCCHFKICSTARKIGPGRAKSSGCCKLSWVGGRWRWELKMGVKRRVPIACLAGLRRIVLVTFLRLITRRDAC